MIDPSWIEIARQKSERGHELWFCLHANNPNPRLYKRRWQLFTRHSEGEGTDFLRNSPAFSMYTADTEIKQLQSADEPVWLYVVRSPRWDPQRRPWDLNHKRWRDVTQWAPAFDDDTDALMENGER